MTFPLRNIALWIIWSLRTTEISPLMLFKVPIVQTGGMRGGGFDYVELERSDAIYYDYYCRMKWLQVEKFTSNFVLCLENFG